MYLLPTNVPITLVMYPLPTNVPVAFLLRYQRTCYSTNVPGNRYIRRVTGTLVG